MYFDNKDQFLQPNVSQYNNHMVMTNVHKEVKTKYWNIDTRFRDDYDNYNKTLNGGFVPSYTFSLPQTINDVKTISIENTEIPISFFNISASLENNFMVVDGELITVPDGFYDSVKLKTVINDLISGSTVFDISLNGDPYSSFRHPGKEIILDFAVRPSNTCLYVTNTDGVSNGDFDKYYIKSKLGWLLGFRNINYIVPTNAKLFSECLVDFSTPRYLYLIIDEFTSSNSNSFISPLPTSIINKNILAKVSIDYNHYPFGTMMVANNSNGYLVSDTRHYNGKVNLQRLKIQLVNEYGKPVHLNGLDFSFCLKITYE
jgi:hypothetical protein